MRLARQAAGFGAMLVMAGVWSLPGQAHGLVKGPAPLSAEMVADIGNKRECISPDRMLIQLHAQQLAYGGKTLALVHGANQNFADTWRDLAGGKRADVSLVLAQGYRRPAAGEAVNIVEFDSDGCAFSQTTMRGNDWNVIFSALVNGPAISI